jgi:hypothetical protein
MGSSNKWLTMDVPSGRTALIIRTITVAVVGFVVLQVKEFIDAGRLDFGGTAVDALLIAAGVFVLNAVLMRAGSRTTRRKDPGGQRANGQETVS